MAKATIAPTEEIVKRVLAQSDHAVEGHLRTELYAACERGDSAVVADLLADGADARYQDPNSENGVSPLMIAANTGSLPVVDALLHAGAPWNAVDRCHRCAGDYAVAAQHDHVVEHLMEWACIAEASLRSGMWTESTAESDAENAAYLSQRLKYEATSCKNGAPGAEGSGARLLDEEGDAVMMEWERPLMLAHANLICQARGDVLNIGFGLGLVDDAIQGYRPRSHTIIEAHPDVLAHMRANGWFDRPGVTIIAARWQDALATLAGPFDGIFFDTYAEHWEHLRAFHAALPHILSRGGVYTYFNGLAPRSAFFHAVFSRLTARHLEGLGLAAQFMELPVDIGGQQAKGWDTQWSGVARRYWFQRSYNLPIVYWADESDEDDGGELPGAG